MIHAAPSRPATWTLPVYAMLATTGVYVSLLTVGGLALRAFELAAFFWILFSLPRLVVGWDWVWVGFATLLFSILMSVTFHGFETDGGLLGLRVAVGMLLAAVPVLGLPYEEGGVRKGVIAWMIGGAGVVALGVLLWLLAVTGIAHLPSMVYQSASGYRAQSLLPDPNRFGAFAAVLASVSGIMVLMSRKKWRWATVLMVSALGVLVSGSRGGVVAGVAGMALALAVTYARIPRLINGQMVRRVALAAVVLVAGAWVLQTYAPERNVFGRFTGAVALREGDQITTNSRLAYARYILDDVTSSPSFLVFGSGDFGRIETDGMYNREFTAHNLYLTVLAAQGLLGLAVFALLLFGLVIRGVRVLGREPNAPADAIALRAALLGGLLTSLVHGLAITLYTTGLFWIYIGLYTAVVSAPSTALLPDGVDTRSWRV